MPRLRWSLARTRLGTARCRDLLSLLPYAAVSGVQVGAKFVGNQRIARSLKPALIPLLLPRVLAGPRPPHRTLALLIAGHTLSWIGDITIDRSFRTGLGAFLCGHLCLIALFWSGTKGRMSWWSLLAVPWVIGVTLVLRPQRIGALYPAVLTYALVLGTMAVSATRGGRRTGLGGLLFVVSDTLLALRQFTPWLGSYRWGAVVMASYLAAQALLTDGLLASSVPKK